MIATERTSAGKHFPWYKERLKWKYIQKIKESHLCCNKWQFLPSNMDDFRSGIPIKQAYCTKKKRGGVALPIVEDGTTSRQSPPKSGHPTKRPQTSTVYSRVGPRIQKQKDILDQAQLGLQEHPLGLYSHLEESLPPKIAEDIVNILDPCLKQSQSSSGSIFLSDSGSLSNAEIMSGASSNRTEQEYDQVFGIGTVYRFPLKKSLKEEAEEIKKAAELKTVSPEQEAVVNMVMQELVDWMKDLGDDNESEYISEATIKRLFASDYQSKPVLTAPIHITELPNIPHELQADSRRPTPLVTAHPISSVFLSSHIPDKDDHLPKSVKSKYGAWYLDTKLWKLRGWNEPLQDPKELDRIKDKDRRMRNLMLDNALHETHGAIAFKEFIDSRPGAIIPKFLKTVGQTSSKKQKTH